MSVDFTMPKLGLTMTDGTIREWLVADGTAVHAGEAVLIIETDKVETEVEARDNVCCESPAWSARTTSVAP